MNTYKAVYMPKERICWEQVPEEELACRPWKPTEHIRAWFQVCWNENELHVRMRAREQDILRRFTGLTDDVCLDSCLEFFFSPTDDGRYLNMEVNPNGAIYLGVRYDRYCYVRLTDRDLTQQLQVTPFTTEDGWGVEYTFPVSFLQLFYPQLALHAGMQLRANAYKCGADTPVPHHLVWNPIDTPRPDFHLPAYFGSLILQ